MNRKDLSKKLPDIVQATVQSILAEPILQHLDRVHLPSRDAIVGIIHGLRQLVFPGYFGMQGLTRENLPYRIGELVIELSESIFQQVRACLRYAEHISSENGDGQECEECDRKAAEITAAFFDRLPGVRRILATDVQAAFDSDPAAHNTDETIFCYPGILAISIQRLAHELFLLGVPMMPRIMTEHAHSQTGIDIHPGARLGWSFFIDHGTGVVIGETTRIGRNVKIYQGVTLGALAPHFGQQLRGQKRHPTIEDDVTIYAGATILGGDTIIGKGTVIGGNVFITTSVPAGNQVSNEAPRLRYRERRRGKSEPLDFQI